MPEFSIIIPCYNAALTIDSTLASLKAQSCTDWEAICVDDGSTDATPDRIRFAAERDSRITLHRNQRKGPSAARNHGA
ncbi:MAG: glycosyltransferase family 2 protein, partial [Arenibacterium sp.]